MLPLALLLHRPLINHSRTLFTLPDLSSLSPFSSTGSEPSQTYHERKVFPYTCRQLYSIVSDVESYPLFIPFCTGSRILSTHPQKHDNLTDSPPLVMEAELTVGFMAFQESYVSRVTCTPFQSVEATATSFSPLFKRLSTTWRFQPVSSQSPHPSQVGKPKEESSTGSPTLVTLDLAYAFANPVHAAVSSAFFGQVSKLMVTAFEKRCTDVYGKK